MPTARPTELPGDKMRKALTAYSELKEKLPEKSRAELLDRVSQKFDLSPIECDFLLRQLTGS